ncbi:glucosamine-6-phosphate deaminase [Brachybacterium paraconglomeratum]
MQIHIVEDAAAGGVVVADEIQRVLERTDDRGPVLGLATGSSPLPAYQELIRRHREEGLSFADARAFLLDEYVGLPHEHEQSYHRFIRENLVSHIDLPEERVCSPDGTAEDPHAEAVAYDGRIRDAGGVDVQVLGIGSNGHIAFNEPGSSLGSRTRVVGLSRSTIADNSRYFASREDVPIQALSQGLGTILEARRIVLVASGENKAAAIAQLVEGGISARWPATVLQMHPEVVVVADEAAASRLELHEDYRHERRLEEAERAARSH